MPQFKVTRGMARIDGVEYVEGNTFEDSRDLDKLFVNKFERLEEKPAPKKGKKPAPAEEVLDGFAEGAEIPAGAVGGKPHKAESVQDHDAAVIKATREGAEDDEAEEEEEKPTPAKKKAAKKEKAGEDLEDVTGDFERAGENDLTVHKGKDGYVVKDGKKTVSDEPLKTKRAVGKFLDSHLDASDEE